MDHKEFNLKSSDGLTLYGQYWNVTDPKAVICLVHGMGEHSGRYAHVAEFFNKNGYSVIIYDQRGHGRSGGKRGHTPSYDQLMDDISLLLKQADSISPGVPKFLYGHSMGGNLVINYALRKKPAIKGVISSSPWLKLAFEPPAGKVKLAKIVNGIFPSLTQSSNLDVSAISRDTAVVNAYKNDHLVHDKISSNMFLSVHESGLWALEHAQEFPLPLLLFHGTADKLTSYKASEEFSKKVKGNITFKTWDGFYHEPHNEPEKQMVFGLVKEWIEKELSVN
jgi:acylglycerol lipase